MSQPAENTIFPRFYTEAVPNNFKSEKQGFPVFENRDFIEIHIAGDSKNIVVREVRESDKTRFPTQWAQYKANQEQVPEGFPLEQWPQLNAAQVATLKAMKIRTVETLAELPDSSLQNIGMGARELQKKARDFLSGQNSVAAVKKELEAEKAEKAEMQKMMQKMQAQIAELAKSQKKKPGRKKAEA